VTARSLKVAVLVMSAAFSAATVGAETAPDAKPGWDQAVNIKDAAERLAKIQRTKGAQGAISHIDACYRTHSLAANYSAPFEACIAQDYMLTQTLAQIYLRMTPEQLEKAKAPKPEDLAKAMGRRIAQAFGQYKISKADAESVKLAVDKHGMPAYLKIMFPNAGLPAANAPKTPNDAEKK
jgi:hypothetical protein